LCSSQCFLPEPQVRNPLLHKARRSQEHRLLRRNRER
jgi:hypothetical protein